MHTKTPWHWIGGKDSKPIDLLTFKNEGFYGDQPQLVNDAGTIIIDAGDGEYDPVENAHDKLFIARACNAHDALVAALKAMVKTSRQIKNGQCSDSKVAAEEQARAALAAAGESAP